MITWRTWFLNLLKDMPNNFVRFLWPKFKGIHQREKKNYIENLYV